MQQAKSWWYFWSAVPGLLVIAGNVAGGYLAWGNVILTFVLLPLLDVVGPVNKKTNENVQDTIPNLVLVFNSIIHTVAIATLLLGVYTEVLVGPFAVGAVISTGLNAGVCGITTAHELIHRKGKWFQNLGIWNLLIVNYAHFYIEHVRGHHRYVGLPRDPATARRGESIYRFFARTVPGQFRNAWHLEHERLHKEGKGFGFNHFVFRSVLVEIAILLILGIGFGWLLPLVYIGQSLMAVFLLESVNYAEHYGLVRQEGQKVMAEHAWQSDTVTSRFTLMELSRHPDHHLKASKPYHKLESVTGSPDLPVGYFAMYYLILIPPIWFHKMNPRVDQLRQSPKAT